MVFINHYPNKILQEQLYRLDISLIVFKRINACLDYIRSVTHTHPFILITMNALGCQIVPEIHPDNQLKAVFIFCLIDNERIEWTTKYDKVKESERELKLTCIEHFR